MTEDRLSLAELLAKAGDGDFLRNVAEAVVQLLMGADVEGVIGSGVTSARWTARPTATGTGTARSTRAWVRCSSGSRNSARAATFRRFSSRGSSRKRRWWP